MLARPLMQTVNIGLIGGGTVGGGVYKALRRNGALMASRLGVRCRPVLEAMGKTITHCGPNGAGQSVKLCNQVAIAGALAGVCEALALAQKSGVDPSTMVEAIAGGAAGSWQLSNLGPKIVARDFAPGFMVGLMQKDLRLALEAAAETQQPLPGTGFVHQLFHQIEAQGGSGDGTQALARAVEALGATRIGG